MKSLEKPDPEAIIAEIIARPMQHTIMELSQCLFKCKNCGSCCSNTSGVRIDQNDITRLRGRFHCSQQSFMKKYAEVSDGKMYLKGSLTEGRCSFFKDNRCSVYLDRPVICRCFPMMNPDGPNGLKAHFYTNCAGTLEMVNALYEYKTALGPEIPVASLDKAELERIGRIKVISFLKGLYFLDQEPYSRYLTKIIAKGSLDELTDFEINAWYVLCRLVPMSEVEGYLKDVVEGYLKDVEALRQRGQHETI